MPYYSVFSEFSKVDTLCRVFALFCRNYLLSPVMMIAEVISNSLQLRVLKVLVWAKAYPEKAKFWSFLDLELFWIAFGPISLQLRFFNSNKFIWGFLP